MHETRSKIKTPLHDTTAGGIQSSANVKTVNKGDLHWQNAQGKQD